MQFRTCCSTVLTSALFGMAATADAQNPALTVQMIMDGPDFVGTAPRGVRGGNRFSWSPDSRFIYFSWRQPGVDTTDVVYRLDPRRGDPERLEGADADTIVAGSGVWSKDRRRAAYVIDGDLVLWENGGYRYLFRTPTRESNPHWSTNGETLFFRSGENLMAFDLDGPAIRQLTDIRSGNGPDEDEPEGQRAFLIEQQKRLFEFIESEEYDDQPWNRETEADSTQPEPFYVGEGKSITDLEATPDGRFVFLTVSEPAEDARKITMPLWITDDGYLDTHTGRDKVGDERSTTRAAVLEVVTGTITFVGDSIAEGEHSINAVGVSSNSQHVLARIETRDREHRWYVVVDLPSLEERVVVHDHDDAWLTFPGPGLQNTAGFLADGETVFFGSERSGWIHLYTVAASGGDAIALTSGEWEVLSAELDSDGATWSIAANREGFGEVHFYTMPAGGGALTRITRDEGRQNVTPSPDGRWLAISHSESNRPWELYVQENRPGRDMRKITESTTDAFRVYEWRKPEIVMIPVRDGTMVPARLHRPRGEVAPVGQRPAVIFVHGAGYLQNVHTWWSGYYREYMFHHLLADRGYTVLALDYRGSAGHGRDWRTAIYRYMGDKDLTDQVDGARWLVQELGVGAERIGIYGGSYGGFITLMAMFTEPGVFQAGAALRPVTDWAHYNDPYTSSILNEPQADTLAYVRSSPIYHAEGLEGRLLMAHGMVDDNVLFYDTVRLAQRLIELGKEDWEVAIYPAERHGFRRASSWTDEYRRILKLFEGALR